MRHCFAEMDRSWINTRLFSKAHLDGVSEFMAFVSERFAENEEILCPCRKCLNQIRRNQGVVEDHLYTFGMSSTYNKWLYHGESSDVEIPENVDHVDEQIGIVAAEPKKNGKAAVSSRVQELESELEAEKREATALREQLDAQQLEMGDLKKHVQNSVAQIETLKQQAVETDIILRKLLMLQKV